LSASRLLRRRSFHRLEVGLRQKLPTPAYATLRGGYDGLRALARRNPGRGRLLPDFIIIGAAKAGTTSLYGWLSGHPYVAPASTKEVHFFDYNFFRGKDWYRAHFPLESSRAEFEREHGRPFLTGEASPSYISHYWAPQRIARMLPSVKLIVLLRNPVDRAYSQFSMSQREGEEELDSFEEALAKEDERLDGERARCMADSRYNSWPIGCWSYLMRSRYAEQLERWLPLFPREQFLFLDSEALARRPEQTLQGVYDFLGLPGDESRELPFLHTGSYDPLPADVRERVSAYFRPHNERLYELLGIDFGWNS
jgi:Sulfotransferase domain